MVDTLSRLQVQENIQQILWGKSFAEIMDGNGEEHTFILRSLTIKESNFLNFIYDRELRNAQQEGILSYEQFKLVFEAQGVWGDEQKQEERELESKKKMLEAQIKNAEFHTIRKRNLKKSLKKIESQMIELNETELGLFSSTAEQRAEEYKKRYMVMMFSETPEEKSYWLDDKSFMQSTDSILLYSLILAYFKNNMYTERNLRQIARSSEWRFRWLAAKHGENLFGRSISEWSEMQNMIVYWSEFYDSIYENSLDRPADHIIEDDNACDAWMRDQGKKNSQGTKSDKNVYGSKRAKQNLDHSEQFIMVPRGDKEAVKKIQEMNPDSVRNKLKREYEQIKKAGGRRIREWDLGNRRSETSIKTKGKGR